MPFLRHQILQLHPIITNIEQLLYTEHNHRIVLLHYTSALLTGNTVWVFFFLLEEEEVCVCIYLNFLPSFSHKVLIFFFITSSLSNLMEMKADRCLSASNMVDIREKWLMPTLLSAKERSEESGQSYLVVSCFPRVAEGDTNSDKVGSRYGANTNWATYGPSKSHQSVCACTHAHAHTYDHHTNRTHTFIQLQLLMWPPR